MKYSELYDLDSVNEAIKICDSHRSLEDYQSGEPKRICRTNIWTALKREAQEIKKHLEEEAE